MEKLKHKKGDNIIGNEDLVNVIRCKDCEHFERRHEISGWCYYWNIEQGASPNMVDNDDYCSNGNKII